MSHRLSNKRVPISCENCRKRKIACSGGRAPCQTCTRRGFASSCYFLKERLLGQSQTSNIMSLSDQETLLSRISNLERLLQDNIDSTRRQLSLQNQLNEQALVSPLSLESPQTPAHVQTGQLVTSSTGHVRYILVDQAFHELLQDDTIASGSPSQLSITEFPFSSGATATATQILEMLPPLSCCDELKNTFMEVFSPLFHILHDPTFEAQYASFRQNPNQVSMSFLSLIFVVLAIAVTALDEDHHILWDLGKESSAGANARTIAARFRNAAMTALSTDQFLWRHNLRTLQALILLIYAMSHAHGPAWSLLGTTLNIAIAIGCHIDPSRYNVSVIEAEERRRSWAALTMMYTIQDTCMGNLSPMNIQADIRPPADIDDEALSNLQHGGEVQHSPPVGKPSKMAYIIQKFRLYRLASEICTLSASNLWMSSSASALDQKVTTEQSMQKESFGQLETLPIYHLAHYYILSNYTNHLYLILHRPCLRSIVQNPISSMADIESHSLSIQRLNQASSTILNNHEVLHATEAFRPYKWYTYGLGSFHVFLAATTLSTIIGHPLLRTKVDAQQVLRQLHQCLKRFEKASDRSETCAKAAEILCRFLVHQGPKSPTVGRTTSTYHSSPLSHQTDRDNLQQQTPAYEPHDTVWMANSGSDSQGETDTSVANTEYFDLDGWTTDANLLNVFSQTSSQQWLSPSSFPWWRWSEEGPT